MFGFFRINDPYRVIIIFFLLIGVSLPFFISGSPLTIPELTWMVIGEKMADGATLYRDIWDDISPLAASVYWLIDEVFGRSQLTYRILGLLLIIIQSAIFNSVLLKHKTYNENNYIPALIYTLLMTSFFDFFTLSPILMSLTLVLPALHLLLDYIQSWQKSDEKILQIGFYLGVGALFFFPVIVYLLAVILALIVFTGASARKNLLCIYGFFAPLILAALYYYWHGALKEFFIHYIYSYFMFPGRYFVEFSSLLMIAAVPGIFLLLAVFKTFSFPGFTNFQVRVQQIMFLMLALGVAIFFFTNNKAPYQLTVFVIPGAFFITHYFLLIRRRFWVETQFLLFLSFIILVNWGSYFEFFFTHRYIQYERLLATESPIDELLRGKKILVLGSDISHYKDAKLATPYLDWRLAQLHFADLNYYDNVAAIYKNFTDDMPEVIVDESNAMPPLREKIPMLRQDFRETAPGIYVRED